MPRSSSLPSRDLIAAALPRPRSVARLRRAMAAVAATATVVLAAGALVASAAPVGDQLVISPVVSPGNQPVGNPAAAYDSTLDRYLVVWPSELGTPGTVSVWGRFMSPEGAPIGAEFLVANVTGKGDGRNITNPRIVYSKPLQRYFLAYTAQAGGGRPADNFEAYGIWLGPQGEQATGTVTLSGGTSGGAESPQLIVNDATSSVIAVYSAIRAETPTNQLYGNVITSAGATPAKRISPADTLSYSFPTVALSTTANQLALAAITTNGSGRQEIGLFRLGLGLDVVGTMVRPVPIGTDNAHKPAIAWNATRNEFAVAWPRQNIDIEVWAARFTADLTPAGPPTQVSFMEPDGSPAYGTGVDVGFVASPASDQYAAFWVGDMLDATHADEQFETWGRALAGDFEDLDNQRQLSSMGPLPGTAVDRGVLTGGVAYDSKRDRFLAVWPGRLAAPGWQLFGRLVEPFRAPAPTPGPAPTPVPVCPGQQQFSTKKGPVCGAPPIKSTFKAGATTQGSRLLRVLVTPTAKGQTIKVRCVKQCGRGSRSVTRKATAKRTQVPTVALKTRVGSTFEIQVTVKGSTPRFRQYKRVKGKALIKSVSSGCRLPGNLKATC